MNDDDIRLAAYQCWQDRGSPEGDPDTDWFQAINILDRVTEDTQRHDVPIETNEDLPTAPV